ncbi:uncharacterized protein TRIADDRAFT_53347 [Trichoplax adhaerens]|uniref:Uncharacterized protein n=1 Tax=Trichoplax adhaerens TaxID=10228 RepID=B3RNZ5_TRIAD|nr:predicted protein [Trichoplax adhaerens]EDV28102.1 predicted protein [Trichoplax adhaerens]|eukprot:XP_002109936.1 predicted protein [Trichoplax adhaerens]
MADMNNTINQFLDNFEKLSLTSPYSISSLCDSLISSITSISPHSISIADLRRKCAVVGQLASFLLAKYKHGGLENTYRKEEILANLAFWSLQLIRTESSKLASTDDQDVNEQSELGLEVYIASLVVAVASHVAFPTVKLSSTNESSANRNDSQEHRTASRKTAHVTVYEHANDTTNAGIKPANSNIGAQNNTHIQDGQIQSNNGCGMKIVSCKSMKDQSDVNFDHIINLDDCQYYWLDQPYDDLQKTVEEDKQVSKKKKISMAEYRDRLASTNNSGPTESYKINPCVTGNYEECVTTVLKKQKAAAKDPRIKLLAQSYLKEKNPEAKLTVNAQEKSSTSSNTKSNDTTVGYSPEGSTNNDTNAICKSNVKTEDDPESGIIMYPLDHLKRKKKNALGFGNSVFKEAEHSSIATPPPLYTARNNNNSSESLSRYLERLAEHVQKRNKTEKVQFIAFDK